MGSLERKATDNPMDRMGASAAMHHLATYWTSTARQVLEPSPWPLAWPASQARSCVFLLLPCCSHCQGRSLRPLWQSTGGATALLLPPSTKTCLLLDGQIETQSSRGGWLHIRSNL